MATEKRAKSVDVEEAASPKKRKADVEELEVDLEAPEPPSKRARRALKKGKPLPPKKDSDDEKAETKKAEKEEKAAKSVRSEHAVWIGNLPFTVTPDELRQWLMDNSGEVIESKSITRINMPTQKFPGKTEKSNKGFAYVDFIDLSTKVAAMTLSENWLGMRKLLIKDATSYEGRPAKEVVPEGQKAAGNDASADEPVSRKIFVGNLSFQTTEDDVRANFDKCGEIDWVKIATFEDSGKCKGYGWVKFREAESAIQAVKGFVKIKEELETEDDFVDAKKDSDNEDEDEEKGDDEEDGSDAEKEKKKKMSTKKPAGEEKKIKTRKWWINRIAGRNIKIELAEDDQVRYKKRFRNGGPRSKQAQNPDADGTEAPAAERTWEKREHRKPAPARELKAQDDLMVARLTGTAAKPTGTKITFD